MITLTYFQLFAATVLVLILGSRLEKAIRDYLYYRKTRNASFMNPARDEITDERIRQQIKTFGKMYRKLLPEHRILIASILELLRRDMNYMLSFADEERRARKKDET